MNHLDDDRRIREMVRAEVARALRRDQQPRSATTGRPLSMTPGQVAEARSLRAQGHSVRVIASQLSLPRSTIHDALRRAAGTKPGKRPPVRK